MCFINLLSLLSTDKRSIDTGEEELLMRVRRNMGKDETEEGKRRDSEDSFWLNPNRASPQGLAAGLEAAGWLGSDICQVNFCTLCAAATLRTPHQLVFIGHRL